MKHARKAKGMSLADVAKRSGLLPEAIARAERAGIDPRVSTALAIAEALGVPICGLLDEGAKHERHRAKRKATR
jgi:transcriptional regulator with XRE-family HTH domain